MSKTKCLIAVLSLCLACALCACGYGFRHQQSNLPPDVKTIAIPMFENKTNEVRMEAMITEQLRFQFSNSQILKIVPQGEADVVLQGTVEQVISDDIALTSRTTSELRRVGVSISARLVRRDTGEVLYNGGAYQWRNYVVSASDDLNTNTARREALRLVAREAALIIHDGALQNF